MSKQEQSRTEVMHLYIDDYIKQNVAHGAKALIHGNRGKVSNRKIRDEVKLRALSLVCEFYYDFGPTFAAEKLLETHSINISSETLRQWMISDGIWKPKKQQHNHPTRERHPRMGELVQIDGTCLICSFTQPKEPKAT